MERTSTPPTLDLSLRASATAVPFSLRLPGPGAAPRATVMVPVPAVRRRCGVLLGDVVSTSAPPRRAAVRHRAVTTPPDPRRCRDHVPALLGRRPSGDRRRGAGGDLPARRTDGGHHDD